MRILLIPSSYPPVLGGLQKVVHTLAKHLSRDHEVLVITNRFPRSLARLEKDDRVVVRRELLLSPSYSQIRNFRADLYLASLYFYPRTRESIRREITKFCPDIVNVHFPDAQISHVLSLRRELDFPLVVSVHGDDVQRYENGNGRPNAHLSKKTELQSLLRQADAITACSRSLLTTTLNLEPSIQSKAFVIYNGIESEVFNNSARYEHPRPYIFSYGRLTFKKGFDMLLEAFARVSKRQHDIDLIIAGEGEEHQPLKKQAKNLHIADRVILMGRANEKQVIELLNGSLFVAVPSRIEPFGLVALEAMAAQKAIVATNLGGLSEFVDPVSNCLVESNVDDITRGLNQMLNDRARLGERGRRNQKIAAAFDWTTTASGYLSLYKKFHAENP